MAKQQKLDDNWRMTPKQALFVAEYLKDLNATQAAIRAGFSEKTAKQQASRLLSNVNLQGEIERRKAVQLEDAGLSATRVLEEYRRVAFANILDFHDERGNIRPVTQWTRDMGAAVAGLETIIKNAKAGDGVTDEVLKLKLADKLKALQDLGKHFGLLVDRVQISGDLELVSTRLAEARRKLAEKKAKTNE